MTTLTAPRFSLPATEQVLPDGTNLVVRGLDPRDGDALRAFHESLSTETVYYRFFCARGPLTDAEVHYFTHVDQRSRVAFGVFADGVLVAVGRYDRLPGTTDAEVACVVTDAWQHHGVGTLLLARLVEVARRSGVRRFVAETLLSNTRMLRLLSEVAPMRTSSVGSGLTRVLVDLPARPDTTLRCLAG
jgi:GNAT superfamily N-acetyltransferase